MTELHTSASHVNDYILVTISLPTDYTQQLLQDNSLGYIVRDYISHSTSTKSHYTLRLSHYQGASLINFNFNDFILQYAVANGYIWDFHLLINTQQVLHLEFLHPNDRAVRRAAHCIWSKTTEYDGHYLLTDIHAQLLRTLREQRITMPVFPVKDYNRTRGSGEESLNYMREPATVQALLDLRQGQRDYWRNHANAYMRHYNNRNLLTNSVQSDYIRD